MDSGGIVARIAWDVHWRESIARYQRAEVVDQGDSRSVRKSGSSGWDNISFPMSDIVRIRRIHLVVVLHGDYGCKIPLLVRLLELWLSLQELQISLCLSLGAFLDHDDERRGLLSCAPTRLEVSDHMLDRVEADHEVTGLKHVVVRGLHRSRGVDLRYAAPKGIGTTNDRSSVTCT